jgi:hypothetical protein
MRDVGVIDYLGLTSALTNHLEEIAPIYSNILVDDGRGARAASSGARVKWLNMNSLLNDLHANRRQDLQFGPNVAEELRGLTLTASELATK